MSKMPTYNDLMTGTSAELKKTYKITDRQLEVATRRQMDGANSQERREFYESVYNTKRKS
jgi:hypothetical protein